jgi:hypothetical protein
MLPEMCGSPDQAAQYHIPGLSFLFLVAAKKLIFNRKIEFDVYLFGVKKGRISR